MVLNDIVIVSELFDQMKEEIGRKQQLFVLNCVQLSPGLHRKQNPSLC